MHNVKKIFFINFALVNYCYSVVIWLDKMKNNKHDNTLLKKKRRKGGFWKSFFTSSLHPFDCKEKGEGGNKIAHIHTITYIQNKTIFVFLKKCLVYGLSPQSWLARSSEKVQEYTLACATHTPTAWIPHEGGPWPGCGIPTRDIHTPQAIGRGGNIALQRCRRFRFM